MKKRKRDDETRQPIMQERNRDDEARQLMMHADVLDDVNARYDVIRKEMEAYIAETDLTPISERTDAWQKAKEKRLEEYYDRIGEVTDRWVALDAAIEEMWGERGIRGIQHSPRGMRGIRH